MITDRLRRYSFLGCNLQLIGENLFFVKITSSSPEWELTTPIPKRCPFEALMVGELEVLKAQTRSTLSPACVVQVFRGDERIVTHNEEFGVFDCYQIKNSIFDVEEYRKILNIAKCDKKDAHLQLVTKDGRLVNFRVKMNRSLASVVNWLYCEAVP